MIAIMTGNRSSPAFTGLCTVANIIITQECRRVQHAKYALHWMYWRSQWVVWTSCWQPKRDALIDCYAIIGTNESLQKVLCGWDGWDGRNGCLLIGDRPFLPAIPLLIDQQPLYWVLVKNSNKQMRENCNERIQVVVCQFLSKGISVDALIHRTH